MKKLSVLFLLSFVTLELCGYLLSALKIEPTGFRLFINSEWLDSKNAYADRDSVIGVWHQPNDRWLQNGPCFTAEMTSNQFGARDNSWDTSKKGYLFLGSSFIEGYGVQYEDRASEHFEKLAGKEVFNCAMSGTFTPVQYYLTMHKFKNILQFDTCFVFFIIPNDETSITKIDKKRYRPYLVNDSIIYTTSRALFPEKKDIKEKFQLFVQQYSYVHHLFAYSKNRNLLKSRLMEQREVDAQADQSYPNLTKIMSKFSSDFPDKQFFFVLIPTLSSAKTEFPRISSTNVHVVDIRDVLNPATDYFNCNSHWNENGHRRVAEALHDLLFTQ